MPVKKNRYASESNEAKCRNRSENRGITLMLRSPNMRKFLTPLSLLLLLNSSPALAQVKVSDAWVRGTVEGQRATGAFMTLISPTPATLVAAASPAASAVEMHQMTMDAGMMRMRPVDRVPLPAGQTVELKSGGYHLMLMSLDRPMRVGDTVPITLTIEDGAGKRTTVQVNATVRPLATPPGGHMK